MKTTQHLLRSSLGKKLLMATTGLLLVLFVIVHMLGNLQVFLGPEAINKYAAALKSMPGPLWAARLGLLAIFVLHVVTAFQLRQKNASARPQRYMFENTVQATLASRTMLLTGSIILLYVIGHLLHFTLGIILPEHAHYVDAAGRHDVYKMIVLGFQNTTVSVLYILSMLALGLHLSHGISSMFQTLGIRSERTRGWVDKVGPVLSGVIVIGYIAIPLAVIFGVLTVG